MSNVGLKRILIYKDHLFPETRKPLRSTTDYLLFKNPDLDKIKVKKMSQLLDEEEKKRLRAQRDLTNEEINFNLQRYNERYIEPFEKCPQFYAMLFKYAVKKTDMLTGIKKFENKQEPFFLSKKQIKQIVKNVEFIQSENSQASQSEQPSQGVKERQAKSKSGKEKQKIQENGQEEVQKRQRLLFEINRSIYPSQRAQIYAKFMRDYRRFLLDKQQISKDLLEGKITYIRPMLFVSPVEYYQLRNPDLPLKQCETALLKDVILRERINLEFIKQLEGRQRQLKAIEHKSKVNILEIMTEYRRQFYKEEKFETFYTMLKQV